MSGRNDEANGMAVAFAIIGTGIIFLGAILFAALILVAVSQTAMALAIIALNRPVRVFKNEVTPEEAWIFLFGCVAGTLALPAFVAFCAALYGVRIDAEIWPWLFTAGYVGGAVVIDLLIDRAKQSSSANAPAAHTLPTPPPPVQEIEARPVRKPEPFRYASWDDEELR